MTQLSRRETLIGLGVASLASPAWAKGAIYWPVGPGWDTTTPEVAGFVPEKLASALAKVITEQKSKSAVVLRGGRIVAEAYAPGWTASTPRIMASATKSWVSILIGMAIDDGFIKGVEQSAGDFVPGWKGTPKAAITIRHLLTMSSGLDQKGLRVRGITGDQFVLAAAAPLIHPPGTVWDYNTPIYHLLFHILNVATGEPFISYATRKLVKPLGMEAVSWETDMGQGATGPVTNIYAAKSCAHDMARFALFLERGGAWNGKQLVSKSYFKAATSPSQAMNRAYGYLIWLNAEPGHNAGGQIQGNRFGPAPRDTISAIGAEGQYATAIPSLDLCLVRQGDTSPDPAAPIRFINEVVWSLKGSAAPDTQTSMPAT